METAAEKPKIVRASLSEIDPRRIIMKASQAMLRLPEQIISNGMIFRLTDCYSQELTAAYLAGVYDGYENMGAYSNIYPNPYEGRMYIEGFLVGTDISRVGGYYETPLQESIK